MLASIFSTFANCFKIPELKARILFTLLILVICRLVAMIPIPGLDGVALSAYFAENAQVAFSVEKVMKIQIMVQQILTMFVIHFWSFFNLLP